MAPAQHYYLSSCFVLCLGDRSDLSEGTYPISKPSKSTFMIDHMVTLPATKFVTVIVSADLSVLHVERLNELLSFFCLVMEELRVVWLLVLAYLVSWHKSYLRIFLRFVAILLIIRAVVIDLKHAIYALI